jgi:chaperone modulatory protein CbpM
MMDLFSDDHLVTIVPGLTPDRLFLFLEARLVIPTVEPADNGAGHLFTRIDVARLQFLCELADDLGLDVPTLGIVIELVDKLHAARNDLRILAQAIEAEPPDVRARIGMVLKRAVPGSDH